MAATGSLGRSAARWPGSAQVLRRAVPISGQRVLTLTLAFGGAFSLLLGLVFHLYQSAEREDHQAAADVARTRLLEQCEIAAREELGPVLADVGYLRGDPDIHPLLENADEQAGARLTQEYVALLRHTGRYDEAYVVDADGRERVAVGTEDGRPLALGVGGRPGWRGQPSFSEALRLPEGHVYVSLSVSPQGRSRGAPATPPLQVATPLFGADRLVRGVLVLGYRGQRMLDRLGGLVGEGGALWLISRDGAWLMGPGRDGLGQGGWTGSQASRFAQAYPQAWEQMSRLTSGTVETGAQRVQFRRILPLSSDEGADAARPASLAGADYVWIAAVVSDQDAVRMRTQAAEPHEGLAYGVLASFSFAVAGALAFAYVRSRGLARALEQIVDNLPEFVAYVDADQRYRFNNLSYTKSLGIRPNQLYGRGVRDVLGAEAYERLQPQIRQALAGQRVSFDTRLNLGQGCPRDMSVSYIPDVTESGEVRGFYAVARDITELRAAERRERQRMLELAHVSRFASMGAMATEIAHEVNQPLAAIAMYSAACLRTLAKGGDTAVVTGWLTSINAQAKRVGEVVQRLRQFLQMGGAERAPIGMNEVVREVAGLASVEARAQDVDLLVDLAPELPAVLADRILLEQVVLNLVRNALDAVGQQTGPRRVVVQTRPAGEGVEVSVADNGPGVPAGLGRNVFDSFVSSKPGALGMGLAVSRSIVEAHEGGISYTNNPEGGSTFRFTLPSASV